MWLLVMILELTGLMALCVMLALWIDRKRSVSES